MPTKDQILIELLLPETLNIFDMVSKLKLLMDVEEIKKTLTTVHCFDNDEVVNVVQLLISNSTMTNWGLKVSSYFGVNFIPFSISEISINGIQTTRKTLILGELKENGSYIVSELLEPVVEVQNLNTLACTPCIKNVNNQSEDNEELLKYIVGLDWFEQARLQKKNINTYKTIHGHNRDQTLWL